MDSLENNNGFGKGNYLLVSSNVAMGHAIIYNWEIFQQTMFWLVFWNIWIIFPYIGNNNPN